jgi:ssDNA-binding Zn-finger/Zn-ribbon topoisomerase 1
MRLEIDTNKYNELIKQPKGTKTGLYCQMCGAELVIREGYNKFLGCSGYPICKNKYSLENTKKESCLPLKDLDRISRENILNLKRII